MSDEQIHAYRQRSLRAEELLDVSEHVGGCAACRARLSSPEELMAGVAAIRTTLRAEAGTGHATYEQIEAYVDGTIAAGSRSALDAHLRDCSSCAAEVKEIEGLRRELQSPQTVSQHRGKWQARWEGWFAWKGALLLAAAASVLVAIVWVRAPRGRNENEARVSSAPDRPAESRRKILDGAQAITLASGGKIEGLEQLRENDRAMVQHALAGERIEAPASLRDLASGSGVLLGSPSEPGRVKLLEPIGTVVEDVRPTLRWEPLAGATYWVSIYDGDYNPVAESGGIMAAEWTPAKPLRRGSRYSWQLRVRQNGSEFTAPAPPAPEARFRVLGDTDEAEITRAKTESGGSHLVLGILYARSGVLDQAERELQALRAQNPESREVANLLANVEGLRTRTP